MRYGSVCSGIEAATMAWHGLGWTPAFFSDIEKFPVAVLQHHYPDVPCHGDFTTIKEDEYGPIDLLVGGTPCQSFSVAGLRGGMDDERGNLALEFIRLAQRKRPQWLVWENVPGVLSSNGGRDFGSFLGALAEIGYGFAYRVLDAQYFGVAQRRRRVFVVGYLGDWRRAAAVLFERESLSGNPPPSREEGQKVAPAVTTGPPFSRTGNERVECEAIVPMTFAGNKQSDVAATLETTCHDYSRADGFNTVSEGMAVRRLTPTECERLQGFPQTKTEVDICVSETVREHSPLQVARSAEKSFSTNQENPKSAVHAHVLINLEQGTVQLLNAGKLILSASNAEPQKKSRLLTEIESSALALAGMTSTLEKITQAGKEESPLTLPPSITQQNGRMRVEISGLETEGLAKDAEKSVSEITKFTISRQGQTTQSCDLNARILSSSVYRAISGFIPEITSAESSCITVSVTQGFTQIPYRNKPADKCPDGPRYKALGNSMAVPVMRWIGERIQAVEAI